MPRFIQCCAFNNESTICDDKDNPGQVMAMGLPTEAAIKVMVEKLGRYDEDYNYMESKSLNQYNDHTKSKDTILQMLEFSRERKAMSVLCTDS